MSKNLRPRDQREVKPQIDWEPYRIKDSVPVRGKFIFHEVPGGVMRFSFKKYKGDKVAQYEMYDGEIYTVPLAVAKHLNKECKYPIHAFSTDENGKPNQKVGQWVRRCSFQSLEFMEQADLVPEGTGKPDPATV